MIPVLVFLILAAALFLLDRAIGRWDRRRVRRIAEADLRALMFLSPHPRRRTSGPTAAAGAHGARTTPAGPHPEAARPTTSVGAGRLPYTPAPTGFDDDERWTWK